MVSLAIFSILLGSLAMLSTAFVLRSNCARLSRRFLNRIIVESNEVKSLSDKRNGVVSLAYDDPRALHISNILKLEVGDPVRMGIADVGLLESARIESLENGITIHMSNIDNVVPTIPPAVDLILALPRPQKLERLLPIISCLGVANLHLVSAAKVEKAYFGSHLLRHPEEVRRLLVEGLSQAEVDCAVPKVSVHRSLRELMNTELAADRHVNSIKMVAHPPLASLDTPPGRRSSTTDSESSAEATENSSSGHDRRWVRSADSLRFSQYTSQLGAALSQAHAGNRSSGSSGSSSTVNNSRNPPPPRVVLAVGPEGGWVPSEVRSFQERGFQLVQLGPRILRSDIAVPVLLGLTHEFLASIGGSEQ